MDDIVELDEADKCHLSCLFDGESSDFEAKMSLTSSNSSELPALHPCGGFIDPMV